MSKYDDIVNMYHRIYGGDIEDIKKQVMRNATIGSDSMSNSVLEMAKPRDSVLDSLDNLQASYKKALEAELEMPMSTVEKKLTIETAMSAPTMNLSFISDMQKRKELNDQWQNIALTGLPENMGYPSVIAPSGNIRSATAYLNMPQPLPGETAHPSSVLMSGRAISISTLKSGENALSVSGNNIPTRQYLETMMERSDPKQFIQKAIDEGRKLTFMTSDIETGGVGPYDLARSVFGQTYEMPTDTAADVASALKGISQSTNPSDTFNFHMLVPEMQTLTRGQRGGGPSVQLGGRLADIETGRFLGGGRTAAGAGKIFDLATEGGRTDSAAELTKYFEKLIHPDTVLVGNNFVNFDIPKLIATASTLPEFMKDPRAKEILEAVQKKAKSGNVIDVTEMSRQYLSGKMQERMAAATMSGVPDSGILDEGLKTLLSVESLAKAGIEGEGIKPFSIENVVTSTNVLEIMHARGGKYAEAVEALAKGSHVSSLDATLSMGIYESILSGDLNIVDAANRSAIPAVRLALNAVSRATATVPTANIASIEEMSDQVFNFLTDKSGASNRTLMGARVQTINGKTGEVEGFMHYNPSRTNASGKVVGGFETVYFDPSKAQDTATGTTFVPNTMARDRIRRAMSDDSDNLGVAGYIPKVISTGINVSQASQMNSTLAAVSRFSGLSTVSRVPGTFLGTEADEDAFIGSMTATRKHIGFPHLRDQPNSVTSGPTQLKSRMLGRFDVPGATAMIAAQDAVYQGGAGLAVLDPVMRSSFVALSTQTHGIPFQDGRTEMAKNIAKKAEAQRALAEGRIVTDADLEAFVSSMSDEQIQNINLRAAESSKYLSEQTIIHVPTMTQTRMMGTQDGIVTGKAAKPLISQSVLSEMVAKDSAGAMVPIVDSELWKKAGLDTATFSIVKAQDKDIVNLVLGKGKMSSENATQFAHSLLTVLEEKAKDSSAEQLVEDGYAYSVDEAKVMKHLLDKTQTGASEKTKLEYVQGLVDRLMESGPAIGALQGTDAQGPKAILEALGSEIGNDQPAIARGAVFQIQNVGEETISVSGGLPQVAKDQLDHMGGAVSAETNAELAGGLMESHMQALAKAETSQTFRQKLINSFHKARVETGIFGTKVGKDRTNRDISILESLEKIKPKLAMGAIAVGAASAGYYLAKRNRTSKMYDQTMRQQPYEDTGLVQQANSSIQQDNPQTSARRDPLVTAGVVGNLDRNKIGHTGMGPNKYNHLYGG